MSTSVDCVASCGGYQREAKTETHRGYLANHLLAAPCLDRAIPRPMPQTEVGLAKSYWVRVIGSRQEIVTCKDVFAQVGGRLPKRAKVRGTSSA
jgi:hypothetical protein